MHQHFYGYLRFALGLGIRFLRITLDYKHAASEYVIYVHIIDRVWTL